MWLKRRLIAHWRGQDTFWQSWLLNPLLIGILSGLLIALLVIASGFALGAFGVPLVVRARILVSVIFLWAIVFTIWSYVGLFRYGVRVWRDEASTAWQRFGGVVAFFFVALVVINFAQSGPKWVTFEQVVQNQPGHTKAPAPSAPEAPVPSAPP